MSEIGRTANEGRVDVARIEPEIFGKRDTAKTKLPGGEEAIDITDRQASISKRAHRAFGMDLLNRMIRQIARRVLIGAHDMGLASNTHLHSFARSTELRTPQTV